MKETRLIIFDLDGTLVNAYPAIIRSFNYTAKRMGYPGRDNLTICRAVGWGDRNLLKPFIKIKDLKRALSIYRRHHRNSLIRDSRLFSGAGAVLSRLKDKGFKLAVASNRPTRFSRILIRHLKLTKYFDYVLCADRLRHIKPHPEILNKILRKFSVEPEQALYVGDMAIDAQAGRRAKIRTVIVTTGSSAKPDIIKERPYRIISEIKDLFKIL